MSVDRYPTCCGKATLDPRVLRDDLASLGLDAPFWGLVNSIRCPVGQEPGSAWFLVSRTNGDAISKNAFQSIVWKDDGNSTTFQKYVLCKAMLVGSDGDSEAPYFVELRDKRQVMKMAAVDKEYNVRQVTRYGSTATTDLFYSDTLNSGSPWTWQGMLDDVWGNLPSAIRGTSPTLAYTPANQPENFRFHGSAMNAVGDIMAATQSVLCLNPIADTFSVQRLGATQSNLSASLAALNGAGRRLFSAAPITDLNLSSAPEKIRFYFPRRVECETQLADVTAGGQLVKPYYIVEKATSLTGAQAGTILPIVTNFIAELENDGTTIRNSSALDTLATELAQKITNRIDVAGESLHDYYSGIATTILPGCEIHEVIWRDYGDDDGCVTEFIKESRLGHAPTGKPTPPVPWYGEALIENGTGSDIAAGSSGTFKIYIGTAGSETDSGLTITAYNKSSVAFKNTKFGALAFLHGQAYAVPWQT